LFENGILKFKSNFIKCPLPWNSNKGDKKDPAMLGFEMKLPERNLIARLYFMP